MSDIMPSSRRPTFLAQLAEPFAQPLKRAIASEVVAIFNDQSRDEKPVVRSADGLFGPKSVVWRVHGDVTRMMVGGVAALLLQMLHPAVLAGVWGHSNCREAMRGGRRVFSHPIHPTGEEAEAGFHLVRAIHDRIGGTLPGGTPYSANDP